VSSVPEISLGWQLGSWIESLLVHGPGDVQGEPIVLDIELLSALVRAYEVDGETGRRLIRRYILSRSKGRAKSEWAGMVVCAEFLGPVRFDHWAVKSETSWWGYEYEAGEPVGAPITYPFIRCLATEEFQSGNTYDNVRFMLEHGVDAGYFPGVDVGLTRVYKSDGGEIRPSTASNASKDGGKESFAVFDETHLYVLLELRAMHATVRRNLRKRKIAEPWSLETTTMYEVGALSVAESTFDAVESGKMPADVFFDHHSGPDPESFDWDDDDQLRAALIEAYGPAADWMDLDGMVSEIRDPETERADAVRYFLNRAEAADLDICAAATWDRLAVDATLKPRDHICVGFDGSDSEDGDGTGLVIVRASDGLTVRGGLWERTGRNWTLPRQAVRERVAEIFETYRVVRMYADPAYWQTDIDEWAGQYGEKKVARLPQSDIRIAEAADRFVTLIRASVQAADGKRDADFAEMICHDGDSDLRRHVLNGKRERIGGRAGKDGGWRPVKKKTTRKIDLLSAAMFAHKARGDAIAAGEIKAGKKRYMAYL
jgi:phage terminase large subunit-like protein